MQVLHPSYQEVQLIGIDIYNILLIIIKQLYLKMATSNFKVVCVIKCKKEEVLPIITNIKTFNTNNPGDKIKYTYIKNINSKDDEQFDAKSFRSSYLEA